MKKLILFLLIIFFSDKINAYEIIKPFNIELGKQFKTDLNITGTSVYCSGTIPRWAEHLNSSSTKHKCFYIETLNEDFSEATVLTNKDENVENYKIDDVLVVDVFKEGFTKYECQQFVKNMRDDLIINHGYISITLNKNLESQIYDPLTQIVSENDYHSWWEGVYKNLGIEVTCYANNAIAVNWALTDIKLKGISTDF